MTTTTIGTVTIHRSGIGDFGATRESKLSLDNDAFQMHEALTGMEWTYTVPRMMYIPNKKTRKTRSSGHCPPAEYYANSFVHDRDPDQDRNVIIIREL